MCESHGRQEADPPLSSFRGTFLDCGTKPSSECDCNARQLGDDCERRGELSTGTSLVSTRGMSTCRLCGSCPIQRDGWWQWIASCTGMATISLCGVTSTKTMLGVYRGCPDVSTPSAIGDGNCNDFGSCGSQENGALAVESGETIIFRVGAVNVNDVVTANLSISCEPTSVSSTSTLTLMTSVSSISTAASVVSTTESPTSTAAPLVSTQSFSATAPTDPRVGLIAGVAGGVAALLVVVGVIAFVVWRRRRSSAPPQSAASEHGNVLAVRKAQNEYGDVREIRKPSEYESTSAPFTA